MSHRLAPLGVLAALLVAAAPETQEPVTLNLTFKGPFPKGRTSVLQLTGEGKLPNLAVVEISILQHVEYWKTNKLESRMADTGGFITRMENGKFSGTKPISGPGVIAVRVDLLDENQNEAVGKLTKNLSPKKWMFTFSAFGDDFMGQLETKLDLVDELAAEALAILKEFQEGTVKEDAWKTLQPQLEPRIKKLNTRADQLDVRDHFRAAMTEIISTISGVQMNLRYIVFKDGKFAGAKDYHAGDNQVKTHRNDAYAHENFNRYIEEAPAIAGRELCLWVVKDFRRMQNALRPETAELIKRVSKRAGVAEFAERLAALSPETVEALEKDVREAKIVPPPEKKK